jgi:hypothetical protein
MVIVAVIASFRFVGPVVVEGGRFLAVRRFRPSQRPAVTVGKEKPEPCGSPPTGNFSHPVPPSEFEWLR